MTAQNLTYDDAAQVMLDRVFAPVFFNKLASVYGVAPADQAQAVRLLQLAERERQLAEREDAKSAAVGADLIEKAHSYLDQVLGPSAVADPTIKAAATAATQDQLVRDAALMYQDAMNQMRAA